MQRQRNEHELSSFNGMEKGEGEQEWEISKENVMPIKQGRSVPSLNQALQCGTPQRNRSIQEKVKYEWITMPYVSSEQEQRIQDYIGSDPLSPWLSYCFFDLNHASDTSNGCKKTAQRTLGRI